HQPPRAGYVTTTDEDGTGSLRWAIANAQQGDTITFAPDMRGKTFILHNADLHIIQQNLIIQSPAVGRITIREIGASFIIDKAGSVTISDLAFVGSNTKSQPSLIDNRGKLTLTQCTVSGNSSLYGGGIFNHAFELEHRIGMVTLSFSTVVNNSAS